jgi:hypothetical protein
MVLPVAYDRKYSFLFRNKLERHSSENAKAVTSKRELFLTEELFMAVMLR